MSRVGKSDTVTQKREHDVNLQCETGFVSNEACTTYQMHLEGKSGLFLLLKRGFILFQKPQFL